MAYNHGVSFSEVPTSILPPASVTAGIPFIVGTAPVGMTDAANVNKPVLCYSYAEAVAAFGFVPAKEDEASGLKNFEYSISEFIQSQFALFGVAPVIIVNVLDPAKHKTAAATTSVTLDTKTGSATISETGIVPSTVTVTAGEKSYVAGEDYVASFDEDGNFVITSLKGSDGEFLCAVGEALTFAAEKTDPTKVTADDIVGGVDVSGNKSGLELIGECFPRFRLVPGIVLAPGFSGNATVAAVMAAKCSNINEHFKAISLVDVPTDKVKAYTEVAQWKNENNIVDPLQIACWPMVALDGTAYHMSTQFAGLMGQVDSDNDDVPYVSPSNKNLQMTAAVLSDGSEVWLGPENGAYLNSQGIVTALNFTGGWVAWGNRTACYPGSTDVKDAFIPVRRMFNWVGNTLVQTFWQRVDAPLNRRHIDTIVDSANIWLNGLAARQYILGGRVEFLESENPTTDLMDGIARFHVSITPPSPNRSVEFILEYDVNYLSTLFD
ncbi:MAG: phage tail sheath family protein [Sutterella sp.]